VLLDDGVHDGLGKHRLINLIVTVFPEKGEKCEQFGTIVVHFQHYGYGIEQHKPI
jgi:hypothetical protein